MKHNCFARQIGHCFERVLSHVPHCHRADLLLPCTAGCKRWHIRDNLKPRPAVRLMHEHRLQWSAQPELIQQIISGEKTATVSRLEWQEGYDDYTTALRVGAVYTVYDGAREPKCRVRITTLELTRWGEIPPRLWQRDPAATGERSFSAFIADHETFFDSPGPSFEFLGVYFDLVDGYIA